MLNVKCKKCKTPFPSLIDAPIDLVKRGTIKMRDVSLPCPHCGHKDSYAADDLEDTN